MPGPSRSDAVGLGRGQGWVLGLVEGQGWALGWWSGTGRGTAGQAGAFVLYLLRGKNSNWGRCKHQGCCQSTLRKPLLSLCGVQPRQSPSPSPRSGLNLPPRCTRALTPALAKVCPSPASRGVDSGNQMPGLCRYFQWAAIPKLEKCEQEHRGETLQGLEQREEGEPLQSCTLQARGAFGQQPRGGGRSSLDLVFGWEEFCLHKLTFLLRVLAGI